MQGPTEQFRCEALTSQCIKHRELEEEFVEADLTAGDLKACFEGTRVFLVANFGEQNRDLQQATLHAIRADKESGSNTSSGHPALTSKRSAVASSTFPLYRKAQVDRVVKDAFVELPLRHSPFYTKIIAGALGPQKQATGPWAGLFLSIRLCRVVHMAISELGHLLCLRFRKPG